jgi:hypothetical protein
LDFSIAIGALREAAFASRCDAKNLHPFSKVRWGALPTGEAYIYYWINSGPKRVPSGAGHMDGKQTTQFRVSAARRFF